MKFGFKGAAAFAAIGIATLWSAPNATATMDDGSEHSMITTARTAEIISDINGAHDTRVITVRMPDGEQFMIHDWSAGTGPVQRVTHRDFDKDGDLEVRVAYRDGRVIELDEDDLDLDDLDADEVALASGEGRVIWNSEMASLSSRETERETERTHVIAYLPTSSSDVAGNSGLTSDVSTSQSSSGVVSTGSSDMDFDVRPSASTHSSVSRSADLDVDDNDDYLPSNGSAMNMMNEIREARLENDTDVDGVDIDDVDIADVELNDVKVDDDGDGFVSSVDRETEVVDIEVDNDVHMSSVNSYRSSGGSFGVNRTVRVTESDSTVSGTNYRSIDGDDSFVDEAADKVEDAGDMSARGLNEAADKTEDAWDQSKKVGSEVADKTEDAWDMTKSGANEVADKTEDAWDQSKKVGNEVADKTEDAWDMTKRGTHEVADKTEDAWDQSKKVGSEVADKTEDGWDMTKRGANEVADKTEDAWDQTKRGANEVADKLEDAKDETEKATRGGNRFANGAKKGMSEVGDKLEDVKDFFTGDDDDDDDDR